MYKKIHPVFRILIVLLPVWFVWFYLTQAGWYYMYDDYAKEMFIHSAAHEAVDRDYKVLILGDSMSNAAFLPELLSEDTLNLSITGGSCIESYFILKNYIKTHGAPDHVIFASRHDAFCDDSYIESHFYYHQFSLSEAIDIHRTLLQSKDDPEMYKSAYHPLEWYKDLFYVPSAYIPALFNAKIYQRRESNLGMLGILQTHRGNWLALRTESLIGTYETEKTHLEEFKVLDFNDHYFDLFCKLCADNNIDLLLMRAPYSSNFSYSEQFMQDYRDYFDSYVNKYDGIRAELSFDVMDDLYFYDNGHLNLRGAYLFSTSMREKHPEIFDSSLPVSQGTIDSLELDREIETEEPYLSWWDEEIQQQTARMNQGE